MKTRLCLFYFLFPLFCYPASGSLPTDFYFWVGPDPLPGTGDPVNPQGFVVRVSQARGLQIESMLEQGISVGVATRIAAGQVKYNKNYYSPDQPVWNWHVVSVQVFDKATVSFPASILPYLDSKPSDIDANPAQWINDNGDKYTPRGYHIISQVDPARPALLKNVSNRGVTGQGDATLITGFVVGGEQPANVVVRALGPTLSTYGVHGAVANPRIGIYHGNRQIGENSDWKSGAAADTLRQLQIAPADDREAALYLTLLPGAYTVRVSNEVTGEGVVLVEVYDIKPATFSTQ